MKLRELSDILGGKLSGDPEAEITGVSDITGAKQGDIIYISDRKKLKEAAQSKASAVIADRDLEGLSASVIVVDNPQLAFARVLEIFHSQSAPGPFISEKAVISGNVRMGNDVTVHPLAYISDGVSLGQGVRILPGAYLGSGVSIGDGSVVHANVTIRENVVVGRSVVIHSGSVIGSDGFGYVQDGGMHHKIPQVGNVVIEDNVEIGANVTIDRATVGSTIIGSGTKIDNLVQIAHNVKIGKDCIIVSQVGISGSTEIGDGTVIAGQVGVRDHLKIGKGAMVGAQSGVGSDIPEGQVYSGSPAIPHKTWLRAQSIYAKLPELLRRLQELEKQIKHTSGEDQDV